jgi:uncharacterized protein (DUF2384 family)
MNKAEMSLHEGAAIRKAAAHAPLDRNDGWATFVASFMTPTGTVDVGLVADTFRMSRGQFAQTAGLALASVTKSDRQAAPKAQNRVTEILEIISRVRDWAGGEAQAMAWYRSQPIPALDGRTAEALVKGGQAHAVREYLDQVALGGFA